MNYIAEQIAEFIEANEYNRVAEFGIPTDANNARIFKNTDYDFWFLKMKPYLESMGVNDYIVKRHKDHTMRIEFPNGGIILVSKYGSSLESLISNDEAVMFIYDNVYKTDINGLLYRKESDSSITFILNTDSVCNSINVRSINTNICVMAALKGLSAAPLIGGAVNVNDWAYTRFFYEYLRRDCNKRIECTPIEFIEKAFGSYHLDGELMKAGKYTISTMLQLPSYGVNKNHENSLISKWIFLRIPSKYYPLVKFKL